MLDELDKKIESLLAGAPKNFRGSRLDLAWARLDFFAPTLALFRALPEGGEECLEDDHEGNTSETMLETLLKAKELGTKEAESALDKLQTARNHGFNVLNPEIAAYQGIIEKLHDGLDEPKAFNPLKDLDDEMANIWASFPVPLVDELSDSRLPVPEVSIVRIESLWFRLIELFELAWMEHTQSNNSEKSRLDIDDETGDDHSVVQDKALGALISDVNCLAGLYILRPGRIPSFNDLIRKVTNLVSLQALLESFSSVDGDLSQDVTQSFSNPVGRLGMYRFLLVSDLSDSLKLSEDLLCLAPLMPQKLRALLTWSMLKSTHQYEELLTGEIAIAMLSFTDSTIDDCWSRCVSMHKECVELINNSGLNCKPMRDEDFLQISQVISLECSRSAPWEEDDPIWLQLFMQNQQILTNRIALGLSPWSKPDDEVINLGLSIVGDVPDGKLYACGLWCTIQLLEAIAYLHKPKPILLDTIIWTTERLRNEGYDRLAFLLFRACLWHILIVDFFLKQSVVNQHAPFGPWGKIKTAIGLIAIGRNEHLAMLRDDAGYFALCLKDQGLLFASRQIQEIFGASKTDQSDIVPSHNVIDFQQANQAVQRETSQATSQVVALNQSTRIRIVELMGEEQWQGLPPTIQRKLVGIERSYEHAQVERTLAGPSCGWIVDYAKLFEGPIRDLLRPLWNDAACLKGLSESYARARPNDKLDSKPNFRQHLDVLIGAAKIGQPKILDALHKAGADPCELGNKWAREIIDNLSPIRNKAAHEGVAPTDVEADAFRSWIFKSFPGFVRAIGMHV